MCQNAFGGRVYDGDEEDDDDESIKLTFARSYSCKQ